MRSLTRVELNQKKKKRKTRLSHFPLFVHGSLYISLSYLMILWDSASFESQTKMMNVSLLPLETRGRNGLQNKSWLLEVLCL